MLHKKYEEELKKYNELIAKKNVKTDFYNGIFDRYENPVLTREHIPLTWRYDLNPETNPYFMERLGVNAVFNAGAIELNGKYYLVARIEGNDRKSFFGVAESDNGIDGFKFWDYPILLEDTCPEETNVYDMRLTKHEDGYIYGVFCSESKDKSVNDLSAAVAAAGIVRTKDLKTWERLDNLVTLNSPQQRNVCLHPEFVDGKYAFYTRPMDDFIDTGSGGGIGFGLCDDITHAVIDEERMTSLRKYHTITEAKDVTMMQWKIPIGMEFFDQLRENGYYFVDKTPFIQEFLCDHAAVTLLTRPRRFSKILGLPLAVCSMQTMQCLAPTHRSMAPPIPGIFLPGMIQLARLPSASTSRAPRKQASTWPPRIRPKLEAESMKPPP